MNERTVLQLRISYLQHNLKKLPNGWIGTYNNRAVVIINFDPDKPQINNHSRRRYLLSSKKGIFYNGIFQSDQKHALFTMPELKRVREYQAYVYDGDVNTGVVLTFSIERNTKQKNLF